MARLDGDFRLKVRLVSWADLFLALELVFVLVVERIPGKIEKAGSYDASDRPLGMGGAWICEVLVEFGS